MVETDISKRTNNGEGRYKSRIGIHVRPNSTPRAALYVRDNSFHHTKLTSRFWNRLTLESIICWGPESVSWLRAF